jgi:hypothetical protein
MAPPRSTTLIANTVKRVPRVVASRAKASWVPCQPRSPQPSSGPQSSSTARAWRRAPRLAGASSHHSRHGCRTVLSWRRNHMARKAVTAVKAQERASTIPKLHKANTVACGLLNTGKCILIIAVHSTIRLWLDIVALLGSLGYTDTLSMARGGWSCHGPFSQFPKNLPQKGGLGDRKPHGICVVAPINSAGQRLKSSRPSSATIEHG